MRGKKRLQIIGLGVLALVTAILVILSLPQVRNPSVQALPAEAPTVTLPTSDPTTPDPPPSADAEATAAVPTGLPGVAALLASDDDASVLVLGDGSGNETDEWVHLWATEHLAKSRKVAYKSWNAERETWRSAGRTGTGPMTTVWNASMTAPDLRTEDDRVADVWQPADVVLLSYGHRNPADSIDPRLTAIRKAIKAQDENVTILVMIQNPDPIATEVTQRETTQAVKKWAAEAGLDTVNIYDAFVADPAPRYQLVEADGSPSPVGSALWAATFAKALANA